MGRFYLMYRNNVQGMFMGSFHLTYKKNVPRMFFGSSHLTFMKNVHGMFLESFQPTFVTNVLSSVNQTRTLHINVPGTFKVNVLVTSNGRSHNVLETFWC